MTQTKRRSSLPIILGVVAVVLLLCGAGLVAAVATSMKPAEHPFVTAPSGVEVSNPMESRSTPIVLEVITPGSGNVSWNVNGQGGSDNGVTFPYRRELGPFNTDFVVVSMVVQKMDGKGGPLQAKITYGDKVFPCDGSGAYAVVTCTGSG